MTREEAIQELQNCKGLIQQDGQDYLDERDIPLLDIAIEALKAEYEDYEHATLVDIKEPLKVAVVRCKDCLYKQLMDEGDTKYYYCALEDRPNRNWSVDDTDFCSWGERKEV